jgi:hypothetical protein
MAAAKVGLEPVCLIPRNSTERLGTQKYIGNADQQTNILLPDLQGF